MVYCDCVARPHSAALPHNARTAHVKTGRSACCSSSLICPCTTRGRETHRMLDAYNLHALLGEMVYNRVPPSLQLSINIPQFLPISRPYADFHCETSENMPCSLRTQCNAPKRFTTSKSSVDLAVAGEAGREARSCHEKKSRALRKGRQKSTLRLVRKLPATARLPSGNRLANEQVLVYHHPDRVLPH